MTAFRLEIRNFVKDTFASTRLKKLKESGFKVDQIALTDVYTINKEFNDDERTHIGQMLVNPIFEDFKINQPNVEIDFDFALEIGFLPGVTDNVAHTALESIEDLLKVEFNVPEENVYSAQTTFLKGDLVREDVRKIGESIANPLIQRIHIKSKEEFEKSGGMDLVIPKVTISAHLKADEINLDLSDEELTKLGKEGIKNPDGTSRGPLALSLNYLKTIQSYFKKEGRNPTDVELEAIAQTWSEHCKHTIFADPLDEIKEGIYKAYIKARFLPIIPVE
jgi:phosphoribosylformylglycinamidine synthase